MMEERTNSPAARLFRSMFLIRRVEEEIIRLYPSDKIKSPVHLSIGQEAVAAAVCDHLDKDDVLFGTYRGHALDRKSTRLNSSHVKRSRMPSSA